MKKIIALILALSAVLFASSACGKGESVIDGIYRDLGMIPGTFINYGADGQIVFEARCSSMSFTRNTKFDRVNEKGEKINDSSVINVSCGNNLVNTVGFTSIYMTDGAASHLFADSQKFFNLRIQNNDRGIPLVNFAWRDVKELFKGTAQVAQLCDQNNNPIMAFAANEVTMYSTVVDKSTMFKLGHHDYVWISRGSYTVVDTALLNSTQL